ncbi:MAG: DUF192 domain-containing protein [Bacillota bacterium]
MIRLTNVTRGVVLAEEVKPAFSFCKRLKGLLGRSTLSEKEGLLIEPCKSVHTFFMKFTIDVIFYDHSMKVVAIYPNLVPFRVTPVIKSSIGVAELPAGSISRSGTAVEDLLRIDKV